MRHVRFKEVGMENFCCYTEPMIMTINENKLTMITGPNGIGKTTMFDAIPFTFYGATSKGAKTDDVVNNKVGKNCRTWVKFEVEEDGHVTDYECTRYVNYKSTGNTVILMNHSEKDSKGESVTLKGSSVVKPAIENILVPEKLFMNTVFFAQKIKTFFTDLKDSEQKEIFRKILSLDNYVEWAKEAGVLISETEADTKQFDYQIDVNNRIAEDCDEKIIYYENEQEQFKIDKENKIARLAEENRVLTEKVALAQQIVLQFVGVDEELSIAEIALNTLKQEYSEYDKKALEQKSEIQTTVHNKESEFKKQSQEALDKHTMERDVAIAALNVELQSMESTVNEELHKLNTEMHEFLQQGTRHGATAQSFKTQAQSFNVNDQVANCPSCNQEINEAVISQLQTHIDELNSKCENELRLKDEANQKGYNLESQREEKRTSFNAYKSRNESKLDLIRESFSSQQTEIKTRLDNALVQLQQMAQMKITEIEAMYVDAKAKVSNEINELINKISEIKQKLSQKHQADLELQGIESSLQRKGQELQDVGNLDYKRETLLSYIDKKTKIADDNAGLIKEKEVAGKLLDVYKFWKDAYSSSGIPSMLIDEAIPFMNERAGYYLDKIAGGRYQVRFDTMKATKAGEFKDKINVTPFDNESHANSRVQLSGGQERIIDIATILTLCDLQASIQNLSFNILMFDEIFDALDETNVGYVSRILRLITEKKAIYLISHRHIDQIEADEILSFY